MNGKTRNTSVTARELRLIEALELAKAALETYRKFDAEMTTLGRGLYDSSYVTDHALPVVSMVLSEVA